MTENLSSIPSSFKSVASFLKNKVNDIVGNNYGAGRLKIAHSTKKPLIGICKDVNFSNKNTKIFVYDSYYVSVICPFRET